MRCLSITFSKEEKNYLQINAFSNVLYDLKKAASYRLTYIGVKGLAMLIVE